MTAALSPIP